MFGVIWNFKNTQKTQPSANAEKFCHPNKFDFIL